MVRAAIRECKIGRVLSGDHRPLLTQAVHNMVQHNVSAIPRILGPVNDDTGGGAASCVVFVFDNEKGSDVAESYKPNTTRRWSACSSMARRCCSKTRRTQGGCGREAFPEKGTRETTPRSTWTRGQKVDIDI